MKMDSRRTTAQIYQFPVKLAADGRKRKDETRHPETVRPEHWPVADYGSCWYHEAAYEGTDPKSTH